MKKTILAFHPGAGTAYLYDLGSLLTSLSLSFVVSKIGAKNLKLQSKGKEEGREEQWEKREEGWREKTQRKEREENSHKKGEGRKAIE